MAEQDREAAAARRAERKKARLNAPVPEPDRDFAHLTLAQLRDMRAALGDEETRVSYWRRIMQARIDVIESGGRAEGVAGLGEVLAGAQDTHHRLAHISVEPVEGLPPLPDLQRLWATQVDPADEPATAALLTDLRAAESTLSDYRQELFRRIDRVTKELIARYRVDPGQALSALPGHDS